MTSCACNNICPRHQDQDYSTYKNLKGSPNEKIIGLYKHKVDVLEVSVENLTNKLEEFEFQKIAADNISKFLDKFLDKLHDKLNTVDEYKNFKSKIYIKGIPKTNIVKFFNSQLYASSKTLKTAIETLLKTFNVSEAFIFYAFELKQDRNKAFHTGKKLTPDQIDLFVEDKQKDDFKAILQFI